MSENVSDSQTDEKPPLKPGDPFPCPNCGESDWLAHYKVPESQGIYLTLATDSTPDEGDYDGSTRSYDPDENEYYECGSCWSLITLAGKRCDWDGVTELPPACIASLCKHPLHPGSR